MSWLIRRYRISCHSLLGHLVVEEACMVQINSPDIVSIETKQNFRHFPKQNTSDNYKTPQRRKYNMSYLSKNL